MKKEEIMTRQTKKVALSPEEKAKRRKAKKVNNNITLGIIILSIAVVAFFLFNIFTIGFKSSAGGSGTTLSLDGGKKLSNDQYTIGNNPTDVQKEYFNELSKAVEANDPAKIAEYVVKSFVSDYYTWTNKDGNYEVGGVQYIFGTKFTAFQEEARWTFYSDLDLYITQYGRENLIEVASVETTTPEPGATSTINGEEYEGYYLEANWTYKDSSAIDVSKFQNRAYFVVVNNNGRYEITEIQPLGNDLTGGETADE